MKALQLRTWSSSIYFNTALHAFTQGLFPKISEERNCRHFFVLTEKHISPGGIVLLPEGRGNHISVQREEGFRKIEVYSPSQGHQLHSLFLLGDQVLTMKKNGV